MKNTALQVIDSEKDWKTWCDTERPEEEKLPCGYGENLDMYRQLLLIRSWCPDRTLSQVNWCLDRSTGSHRQDSIACKQVPGWILLQVLRLFPRQDTPTSRLVTGHSPRSICLTGLIHI
jgi:hypothetical protein